MTDVCIISKYDIEMDLPAGPKRLKSNTKQLYQKAPRFISWELELSMVAGEGLEPPTFGL